MLKKITLICTLFFCSKLIGQTSISGIINAYAKAISIDSCAKTIDVLNAGSFQNIERVIIMQMKGAEINQANSNAFGNVFNYRGVGNYEINTIDKVIGNTIYFKYKFLNYYNTSFSTQIISLPKYDSAIVSDTLKALKWDGAIGGILALEANDLILNAPIDVSNVGFRGGRSLAAADPTNNCSWLTNVADYWLPKNNWRGSEKGEGIAEFIAGKEWGRGAQATGGGGGNDHNSGGGGGANVEKGGNGGRNDDKNNFSCYGPNPGFAGKAVDNVYSINHFFMGSGGGAGHGNNGIATSGGAGGGIVFLLGKNIQANNQSIRANGQDAKDTFGDGAGGGGAGGTIVFDMETISGGNLFIEAKGGKGGSIDNQGQQRCFGPGGGGAGGRIVYTSPFPILGTFTGGASGLSKNGSCQNSPNGAEKGSDGYDELFPYLNIAKNSTLITAITQQPFNDTLCIGQKATLKTKAVGLGIKFQWQVSANGAAFSNLVENAIYEGVKEDILVINNVSSAMQFHEYQCVISDACGKNIITNKVKLILDSIPKADFNISITGNQILCTNKSQGGTSYFWDFGDGQSSTFQNPSHLFINDGDFVVELSVQNQCGIAFKSQGISIITPPVAAFKSDTTIGCSPLKINFVNTSTQNAKSFKWTFEGGTPQSSMEENPSVTYLKSGVYGVTLEVSNSKYSATEKKAALVVVSEKPTVDFIYSLQNTVGNFTNLSSNNANSFRWDFNDGTFAINKDINKDFLKDGTYQVTLTATNGCGSVSKVAEIKIETLPKADFEVATMKGCAPFSVQFANKSSLNSLKWQWRFPGADIDTSSLKNPIVKYSKPGIYDVYLLAINTRGKDSIYKKQIIIVEDKPSADFTFQTDLLKVNLQNTSKNYISLNWTFGANNQTSSLLNPSFEYAQSGTYKVILEAKNACGVSTISKDVLVTNRMDCEQITASIVPNPTIETATLKFNAGRQSKLPYILASLDGKVLKRGELDEDSLNFDFAMDNFTSGIYILYLKCDKKVLTQKILKVND